MDATDPAEDAAIAALPTPVSVQPPPSTAEHAPPSPRSGGIYIYDPATGKTSPALADVTAKE